MRLIDADALVQKWYKINDIDEDDRGARFVGYTEIVRMINNAPTINEWIPCSERMPSESGDYLATIPLDEEETYTEVLMYHNGRFYEDDDEWGETYHDDVIAWMPLPEPYKEKNDE